MALPTRRPAKVRGPVMDKSKSSEQVPRARIRSARQNVLNLVGIDQRLSRLSVNGSVRDVQQLRRTVRRLVWHSAKEYAKSVRHYRQAVMDRLKSA